MAAMAELLKLKGENAVAYSVAPCNYSVCPSLRAEGQILRDLPDGTLAEDARYVIVDVSDPEFLKSAVPLENVAAVYDHHVGFEAYWTEGSQENADCGETITEMTNRVVGFLDELKAKYKDKDVLLVTHGGVIMIMQAYFYGPPKDNNYLNYLVTNASVTTFQF